jgi:hypothetical protein
MSADIDICPLEGRRKQSDLIMGLVVTGSAAFVAYGHFQHTLLGYPRASKRMLLFAICPGFPVLEFVVRCPRINTALEHESDDVHLAVCGSFT